MSFPRYPAYKDSGVQWLGQIPAHWSVSQSRRMFKVRSEPALPTDRMLTASQKYGVLYQTDFVEREGRRVVEVILGKESLKHVEPDDFIISMRSFQGGIEWCKLAGSTSFHYVMLTPVKFVHPPFFAHLLKSMRYIEALRTTTDLIRDGQELRFSNFAQVDLPVVPQEEQQAIAEFLDRETAKIDALVAEQEQLITLLKEKRQAVISHAVTKGLDPSVPMKDSGVEWLGKVPKHWRIGKVKQFFATTSGSTPNTDRQDVYYNGEIPWIRSLDLTDGDIVEWEVGITPAAIDDTACKLLPVGSVLVAMYGGDGTIGKNGLLRIPAATNQAICALLPSPLFDPEFVLAFMQHQRPYWMVGAEGTRKDPNISQDRVRNAVMPCPPLTEQRVIVEHVRKALSVFESLEKEAEAVIEILNERRSALISAAVTGQIDVRGLAPAQAQTA